MGWSAALQPPFTKWSTAGDSIGLFVRDFDFLIQKKPHNIEILFVSYIMSVSVCVESELLEMRNYNYRTNLRYVDLQYIGQD